jgi:hypothetical protein
MLCSSCCLNLHSLIHIRFFMEAGLFIVAIMAFALLSTLKSRPVALTVIFTTTGFFTRASSGRDVSWNSFEISGISKICDLLCLKNLIFISYFVIAAYTYATRIALFPLGKALTVKLETVNFRAFTALAFLFRLELHPLIFNFMILRGGFLVIFINQNLKKISSR